MEMQKNAMISQQNMQSQQMAGEISMQKIQMEIDAKIRVKQAETAFDIEKLNAEVQAKSHLMAEEFQYNLKLAEIQTSKMGEINKTKEDSKSSRISQQNSEQSQLINQRKNNLPPLKFESNEDSLDGFDLSEFSPR